MNDLADFVKRFRYRADVKDRWTLLDEPGLVYGDCEDFALTVAWLECGESWPRFWWAVATLRVVFWQASLNGVSHMMLWVRGKGWIDNNTRAFAPKPPAEKRYPLGPLVIGKFIK